MPFRPWYPIVALLSAVNIAGIGFAVATAEPVHASVHAVLALALGFAARRLQRGSAGGERRAALEDQPGLEALAAEMDNLRQELIETQDRLDFAERLLAQRPESRRMGPEQ